MPRPTRSVSGAVADDKEFGPEVSSRGGGDGEPKSGRIVDAQELLDAMTCPVSGLVFVDPVTTTCGHTFSRQSLARWMTSTGSNQRDGAGPSCPTCRAPLYHESPHQWPVNTVLVDLAERFLRDEMIEARTLTYKMPGAIAGGSGVDGDSQAGQILGELPLFVLDSMTPGQELTLNVFEERYKLMIRRCLQATRKFGMVGLARPAATHGPSRGVGGDGGFSVEAGESNGRDGVERREGVEARHEHAGASRLLRYLLADPSPPGARGGTFHADHAVECVITAFQELLDGRLLLRCRATRHVRIVDSRDEPGGAGYTCATVEAVVDSDVHPPRPGRPSRDGDASGGDASASILARVCAGVAPDDLADRDRAKMLLSMEMAAGIHHVWLAHVAGRTIGWQRPVDCPAADDLERWSPPSDPPEDWVRSRYPVRESGALGGRSGVDRFPSPNDFLRRSYGGDVENLLAMCGSRPAAHMPTELSWWFTRVANPLPPLGAALELRPDALRCTSATDRFRNVWAKLFASMVSRHGLKPTQFRGARPMADATIASLVCEALDPDPATAFGAVWYPAIAELRDRGTTTATVPSSSDGAPPVIQYEGAVEDSEGRAYRRARVEDVEALIDAVTRTLELPIAADEWSPVEGRFLSYVYVSPSDFEGPGPAMRLPPVPPDVDREGPGRSTRVPPVPPASPGSRSTARSGILGGPGSAGGLAAVARRGGVPAVCWCLHLRLSSMLPVEWDDAVSRIAAALRGLDPTRGAPAVEGTVVPIPEYAPQPGDWFSAGKCVGRRRARLAGRVGASYGRVAGATVGAVVWAYYVVCELFLLTALALGLFGRPGRNRFPQSFVRGAALALAAAALFGVLSYVP
ncbi:predicted protein [Micromonas commoda]|uniref:Uncharacterized protein n=1 Tax=Micromonas commoda (strain RCC299 / NOUM17 / CCMP2709) TaxID=296587 RepID=C1EHN3_MICCC|nr:predicted protein [Micromonas commoda]ACO67536.1 predicted protein [Micromonas commoda]|eukprot:XP_002506278.1 predicted protein [Micromonas commoda]